MVKLDIDPKIDDMVNMSESSKDRWYEDIDDVSEPPDAGEIDEPNSDSSDYEEIYVKKKKKKKVICNGLLLYVCQEIFWEDKYRKDIVILLGLDLL